MKFLVRLWLVLISIFLSDSLSAQQVIVPEKISKAFQGQELKTTSKTIDWSFDGVLYTASYEVLSYPAVTKIDTSANIIFSRYSIDLESFPEKLLNTLLAMGYANKQFDPKKVVIQGNTGYVLEFKKEDLLFDSEFNFLEKIQR